ncbi:hypothetical protein Pelo_19333 [Pelomyxa schiedti]|nr:hypothetical protein Pelo_19333 [Pelomyxa schiedti]
MQQKTEAVSEPEVAFINLRLMNIVLSGVSPLTAMVYLDDIIVFTKGNLKEHLVAVDKFAKKKLRYLDRHIISSTGTEAV